jgi:hypothetical protein
MRGRVVVRASQPVIGPVQRGKTEFQEGVDEWKEGVKSVCACVRV